MQLKQYQQQTLRDLEQYIETLNQSQSLSAAFARYWEDRGVSLNVKVGDWLHPYVNTVGGVPRVTLKVPTAGGKTFIACHAVKRVMDRLQTDARNRVVAWFVPSDTILKQTLEKLQDPSHPYRHALDALFASQVTVIDKEAALMGQGLSPAELRDNLTILVLSAQSFVETIRAKKETSAEQAKPRAFRENGNFLEHTQHYIYPERLIEGIDPSALIQVIAQQNPLVIVDESHNFKADLRVELMRNLNPRFILELTATPRDNSNIVSFIDAMQLKRENMVKLPVVVENRQSAKDVLVNAIRMRNSLEQHAKEMEQQGGRHIRPIVLFQAQPKSDEDNITFDKIKKTLISLNIPENEIKIKTANRDELKGIDLMSRDCEVRYIITVNALKEGWDCPFAYILATLANRTSRVEVEQILGRILRQPYTTQHANPLLNLCYVFTCSNDFRETVEGIIRSLQRAGFSKRDFRELTPTEATANKRPEPRQADLFEEAAWQEAEAQEDSMEMTDEEREAVKEQLNGSNAERQVSEQQKHALQESEDYNRQINEQQQAGATDELAALIPQEMAYTINDDYRDVAAAMKLPRFYKKTTASLFHDEEWIPLEKSMLNEGFDLAFKDASVDLTIVKPSGTLIDLSQTGDDYVPVRRNNQRVIDAVRREYIGKPTILQKKLLSGQVARMIKIDYLPEPDIIRYVERVIEGRDADEIASLIDNIYQTQDAIQRKIEIQLEEHRRKLFQQWLNTGRIRLQPDYTFIERITIAREVLVGLEKGLYAAEETVNDFEYEVLSAISDNENVLFWHRNREKKDFSINGFINHYPDFIVRMRSGRTLLIETKGEYLTNEDTRNKIWLGNKWADLAGNDYRYFMVFPNREVDGAITTKELVGILDEL